MYLNLCVAPAVIACVLSALIGIYVFYKNPKNIQSRVFILFMLFVVVFSIGETMLRLSSNSEEGLLWSRIGYLGVIFMPLTFLHLSFVFPQEKGMSARNKYALFGLYLIGFVVLCIFNLLVSVQDVQWSEWGYRVTLSSKFYFVGIWFIINVISFFFIQLYKYKKSRSISIIERKQIKHIFYGGSLGTTMSIATNIVAPMLGVKVFPLGSIAVLIFSVFIGAAILKYNLFLFKPMIKPDLEKKKRRPKRYELEPSKGYIVREEQVEQGYEIFTDQITHGISGLCITKYPPPSIRDRYGFEKTPLLWFTFKQSSKGITVNPKKLDIELTPQIRDFVKKGKQTIVYIDCFDQIGLARGIENTLKLIKDIKNICEQNHSILLLSVNPKMFDERQLSFLEKEFLEVK